MRPLSDARRALPRCQCRPVLPSERQARPLDEPIVNHREPTSSSRRQARGSTHDADPRSPDPPCRPAPDPLARAAVRGRVPDPRLAGARPRLDVPPEPRERARPARPDRPPSGADAALVPDRPRDRAIHLPPRPVGDREGLGQEPVGGGRRDRGVLRPGLLRRLGRERRSGRGSVGNRGPGEPVGPDRAVSEDQTENTYGVLYAMLTANDGRAAKDLGIDVGRTRLHFRDGRPGLLEPITTSAPSAEGARITHGVLDETHLWYRSNHGIALAGVLRRNVGKMGGRTLETTNAPVLGMKSVAEQSGVDHESGAAGIFRFAPRPKVEPDPSWPDEKLRGALSRPIRTPTGSISAADRGDPRSRDAVGRGAPVLVQHPDDRSRTGHRPAPLGRSDPRRAG
jgi:hypothetical protein